MNRRHVVALALIAGGIAGSVMWLGKSETPPSPTKTSVTPPKTNDQLYASQAAPMRVREVPALPMPNAEPPIAPAPLAAPPTAAVIAEKPPKPSRVGFAPGRLPVAPNLRSAPSVQASPQLQEAYRARTSRAAVLNQRLERHIAELETKLATAGASERAALEHDLTILKAQLEARRPWESPQKPTR